MKITDELLVKFAAELKTADLQKRAWDWVDIANALGIEALTGAALGAGGAALTGGSVGAGILAGLGIGTGIVPAVLAAGGVAYAIYSVVQHTDDTVADLVERLDALDPKPNVEGLVNQWMADLRGFQHTMDIEKTESDPEKRAQQLAIQIKNMNELLKYLKNMLPQWSTQVKPNLTDFGFDAGQAETALNKTIKAVESGLAQIKQTAQQEGAKLVKELGEKSGQDYSKLAKQIVDLHNQTTKIYGQEPEYEDYEKPVFELAKNILDGKAELQDINELGPQMPRLIKGLQLALNQAQKHSRKANENSPMLSKRAGDFDVYNKHDLRLGVIDELWTRLNNEERAEMLDQMKQEGKDEDPNLARWMTARKEDLRTNKNRTKNLKNFQLIVAEIAKILKPLFDKYESNKNPIKYVHEQLGYDIEQRLLNHQPSNEIVADLVQIDFPLIEEELQEEKKEHDLETSMRWNTQPREELWDPKRIEKTVSAKLSKRAVHLPGLKPETQNGTGVQKPLAPKKDPAVVVLQKSINYLNLNLKTGAGRIAEDGDYGANTVAALKILIEKVPSIEQYLEQKVGLDKESTLNSAFMKQNPDYFAGLVDVMNTFVNAIYPKNNNKENTSGSNSIRPESDTGSTCLEDKENPKPSEILACLKGRQVKNPQTHEMTSAYEFLKARGMRDNDIVALILDLFGGARSEDWSMPLLVQHVLRSPRYNAFGVL